MAKNNTSYKNNPNLKRAGTIVHYTQEQYDEYVKCSQDCDYFVENYIKVVHVDHGVVPFHMYPYQKKFINILANNRFVISRFPRQAGKSTTVTAYFTWKILFNPNQNIAILANKGKLANDLLEKIKLAYENLPLWLQQGVLSWNRGSIELENGSRVIAAATSSSAIRGGAYNCIAGNSNITIAIEGKEYDITIGQFYEAIANSSRNSRSLTNGEEIFLEGMDYDIFEQQIHHMVYGNDIDEKRVKTRHPNGISSYNSKMYGWYKRIVEFSQSLYSRTFIGSSSFAKNGFGSEDSTPIIICSNENGVWETRAIDEFKYEGSESIIKAISRRTERTNDRSQTFRRNQEKNCRKQSWKNYEHEISSKDIRNEQRETHWNSEIRRILSKCFEWIERSQEIARMGFQNKSKSRKNSQNSCETSWNETFDRIKEQNAGSCTWKNSLEQRENWNIFGRTTQTIESASKRTDSEKWKSKSKVQIKTANGFKSFNGIRVTYQQKCIEVFHDNTNIICTPDHLIWNGEWKKASTFTHNQLGNYDVFDILNVEEEHSFIANDLLVHNCILLDEFAHVQNNIAENFFASVYPTISSGKTTQLIIVSTPKGLNHYYKMWMDAIEGRSTYIPVDVHWSEVPGRDEKFKEETIRNTSELQWRQEQECVSGDTYVEIHDGVKSEKIRIVDFINKNDIELLGNNRAQKNTKRKKNMELLN